MSHVLSPPSRCSTMRSSRRYPPAPPVFCPPAVFPNPEFLGLFQEGRRGIGRTPRGAHGAHELRLEAMFRRHRKELLNSSAPLISVVPLHRQGQYCCSWAPLLCAAPRRYAQLSGTVVGVPCCTVSVGPIVTIPTDARLARSQGERSPLDCRPSVHRSPGSSKGLEGGRKILISNVTQRVHAFMSRLHRQASGFPDRWSMPSASRWSRFLARCKTLIVPLAPCLLAASRPPFCVSVPPDDRWGPGT